MANVRRSRICRAGSCVVLLGLGCQQCICTRAPYDERSGPRPDRALVDRNNTLLNHQNCRYSQLPPSPSYRRIAVQFTLVTAGKSWAWLSPIVLKLLRYTVCAGWLCNDKSLCAPADLNERGAVLPPGARLTHAPFAFALSGRCWHRAFPRSIQTPLPSPLLDSVGLRPAAWDR